MFGQLYSWSIERRKRSTKMIFEGDEDVNVSFIDDATDKLIIHMYVSPGNATVDSLERIIQGIEDRYAGYEGRIKNMIKIKRIVIDPTVDRLLKVYCSII